MCGSQSQPREQSVLLAKALAVRAALNHAIQLGYTKIRFQSDFFIVKAINSISKPKKIYEGVCEDIEFLSSNFFLCLFFLYFRE